MKPILYFALVIVSIFNSKLFATSELFYIENLDGSVLLLDNQYYGDSSAFTREYAFLGVADSVVGKKVIRTIYGYKVDSKNKSLLVVPIGRLENLINGSNKKNTAYLLEREFKGQWLGEAVEMSIHEGVDSFYSVYRNNGKSVMALQALSVPGAPRVRLLNTHELVLKDQELNVEFQKWLSDRTWLYNQELPPETKAFFVLENSQSPKTYQVVHYLVEGPGVYVELSRQSLTRTGRWLSARSEDTHDHHHQMNIQLPKSYPGTARFFEMSSDGSKAQSAGYLLRRPSSMNCEEVVEIL